MIPVPTPARRGWRLMEERQDSPLGRWRVVLALAEGPLAALVEAVWASSGQGVFEQEAILPRSRTEVLFCLGNRHWLRDRTGGGGDRAFEGSFVSGLQEGPLEVESPADTQMAGVRLRPAGVAAFLRDTPAAIAGAVVELEAVLGPEVEHLRRRIEDTRDLRRRALLLAGAVGRHLEGSRPPAAEVLFALDAIHRTRGTLPIRDLVGATGFSHRWVTERFRAEVGITPKAYARLVRFESAFERLGRLERVHWAEFALDCGYYDQAHLIRDFRRLAGATPAEVLRRRAPDGLGLLSEEDAAAWRAAPDGDPPGREAPYGRPRR